MYGFLLEQSGPSPPALPALTSQTHPRLVALALRLIRSYSLLRALTQCPGLPAPRVVRLSLRAPPSPTGSPEAKDPGGGTRSMRLTTGRTSLAQR